MRKTVPEIVYKSFSGTKNVKKKVRKKRKVPRVPLYFSLEKICNARKISVKVTNFALNL